MTHKGTFSRDVQSIAGSKGTNSGGASGLTSNRPVNDPRQFEGSRSSKSSVPVCFYCKKKGHVMADCWKREKKNVRPTHWLYCTMCNQLLVVRMPHYLQRDSSIPLFVRALCHFLEMENKCPLQSCQLGIKQRKSSAYHPESQGVLECIHQTLKNMIRSYCTQFQGEWDQGIHLLLFAAREAVQESLGFSPFELVFGQTVRGPLKLLKESWLADDPPDSLLDQVSSLRDHAAS